MKSITSSIPQISQILILARADATLTNTTVMMATVNSVTQLAQMAALVEKSATSATQHAALALALVLMTALIATVEPITTPTAASATQVMTLSSLRTENASKPDASRITKAVMPATTIFAFTANTDMNLTRI